MAFNTMVAIAFFIGVLHSTTFAQTTTSARSTTPTSPSVTTSQGRVDPYSTGKWGNPGARAQVCGKSLDAIHAYVSERVARAIELLSITDLAVNLGTGTLIVKPPRVTEANYARSEYQMAPPNRIRSRFYDGRLVAKGVWQFKPMYGQLIGGMYQATVSDMELNATNQLGRTYDGKPTVQTVECKAGIGQYRIDIQGSSDIKVVENCKLDVCIRIRKFFEDAICKLFEAFVKEVINRELQSYPTRVNVYSDQHKVDYSLLSNEPTVNDKCVRVGVEGKYIWRGASTVPFYPSELQWVNKSRMLSFQLSDYTFNTLLHQAHAQEYKFSAADLIPQSTSIQQLLSLNCTDGKTPVSTPTPAPSRKYRGPAGRKPNEIRASRLGGISIGSAVQWQSTQCLGELFENFTDSGSKWIRSAMRGSSDTGDIVYKSSQKATSVFVQSEKGGVFDGSNGVLEVYGPLGQGGGRQLLARADVRLLRAEFTPKFNKANVTGAIKIIDLQLAQATPQSRMITPEWLTKLAQFATPILNEVINDFLNKYAQFSIPLPDKYECTSPEFSILARTMQIDCEVQRNRRAEYCDYCLSLY